jgi:hypothetical protein
MTTFPAFRTVIIVVIQYTCLLFTAALRLPGAAKSAEAPAHQIGTYVSCPTPNTISPTAAVAALLLLDI